VLYSRPMPEMQMISGDKSKNVRAEHISQRYFDKLNCSVWPVISRLTSPWHDGVESPLYVVQTYNVIYLVKIACPGMVWL